MFLALAADLCVNDIYVYITFLYMIEGVIHQHVR